MRRWFRYILRNQFFHVASGIFTAMLLGGLVLQHLEGGDITQGVNPFWWAIVTMTTVGYGDYTPVTLTGRMFAVLVMFAGISLISLLTATISSIFVARKIREDKGLEKLDLQDHIILCGWNKNGEQIIDALQNLSGSRRLEVVLINDLDENGINRLRNRYQDIRLLFVVGDFTRESILDQANLRYASTVVIIPNQTDPAVTNPDEKTIFATLTVKGLAPAVRVIAYLEKRENLTHIKRANADEVIISDDYGAYMIASHVTDPGIPQTLKTLMDSKSATRFKQVPIPQDFVGQSFADLFRHFRETSGAILVGIFSEEENLGIGAILTADSSALDAFIERKLREGGISLKEESKINVTINPGEAYLIKPNDHAIIIP